MTVELELPTAGTLPIQRELEPIAGSSRAERELQQKLVSWANIEFQKIKTGRSRTELQWYLNLAFYFGRQNVLTFDITKNISGGASGFAGRLFIPPAPYYRVRQVINKIRPTIRKEIAKLTQQKPTVSVVPASSEDKDIFAAQAGNQIWESVYRRRQVDEVLERVLFWSSVTGNGFFKCYWDAQTMDTDSQLIGDISIIQETPFHVFVPDLREQETENQPYLIHAQTRSPEYVQSRYGALLKRPVNYNVNEASDILDDSFVNLIGAQDLDRQRAVLIKEVWVKPGVMADLPEGAQFTIVGDQIVSGFQQWPYEHGKYPFAKVGALPSGKYYHDSVINDLIPVQREINRTHSQIIEAKNKMAKPQLLSPKGAVEPGKITSEPGLVIEYEPAFVPPTPIPLSQLPAYVQDELERLYNDYDDISGQHEISQGQTPAGVTAGTAIAFLQEQDDTMLATYFTSMEKAIQKIAHLTLNYAKQYWSEEHTVKVVGSDGSFDAKMYRGSQLRDNTDVDVESGSALPTSKAAKQAFLFDLMKMGMISPETGFEHMDLAGLNKLYESMKLDIREAQRENLRMARATPELFKEFIQIKVDQGQIEMDEQGSPVGDVPLLVPVNSWNNDPVHVKKHNDYRKSQAFEDLPDFNKMLFEAHDQQHQIAMAMKLAEAQFTQPEGMGGEGEGELSPGQPGQEIPPVPGEEEGQGPTANIPVGGSEVLQ